MTDGRADTAVPAVEVVKRLAVGVGFAVGPATEAHAVTPTTSTAVQTQFNRFAIRPS
jgi:hypothetical protein